MGNSKIVYHNNTLIDLTSDTITAEVLLQGYTAHNKSGNAINGELQVKRLYTGTSTPSSSLGSNGDLYLMT